MNILRFLALGDKKLSSFNITHRFTHLFWLGDLNYRVELPAWVRGRPPGAGDAQGRGSLHQLRAEGQGDTRPGRAKAATPPGLDTGPITEPLPFFTAGLCSRLLPT